MLKCSSLSPPQIFFFPTFQHHNRFLSLPSSSSLHKSASALPRPAAVPPWLLAAQIPDPAAGGDGPVEIPLDLPPIFATSDDPSTLQVATSVLLTGAISVFLFRSLRRRAKRSKELKFRSTGVEKTLKEQALDSLNVLGSAPINAEKTVSPADALLGAISAGVVALILYKFTTTVEASLNRQTISDNLSVRQISITIRTIINGLCYLATFVFGLNSLGLFLYSGQLVFKSLLGDSTSQESSSSGSSNSSSATSGNQDNDSELNSNQGDQNSDGTQ